MVFTGPIYIHTFEGNSRLKGIDALKDRLRMRKHCGPYRITPFNRTRDNARTGVGFYQASKGLSMGDAIVDLRLVLANDVLKRSRIADITGYYCDEFQEQTMVPIIARLAHGRGFLAGWTMGTGMCGHLDGYIWDSEEEAARGAHSIAENAAENEIEFQARENARIEEERQAELNAQRDADEWDTMNADMGANN
jgi:hypothetical protein